MITERRDAKRGFILSWHTVYFVGNYVSL